MKTLRLLAALLVAALLSPLAFPQESSEIASLLAKARRGNGIAQYNVGLAYSEGRGVAADPIEAFVWLSLARENGARGRALDTLTGSLDRPTLELAQRRLTERRTELGVRTPAAVTTRTEATATTTPAQAVIPGPAAKESSTAPRTLAPTETTTPGQAQTDETVARLQADREALVNRLNAATADVAALRAERDRLINLTAEHEKTARAANEANQALQEKARSAEARATELALAADNAKGELTRVRMALTAAQKAVQPVSAAFPDLRERVADLEAQLAAAKSKAPDTAALDQKTRELQAALNELEASRAFGRQVEDTLNKVNDDRARVAATAAAELEAARAFGQQVESTLNRVTDQKTALENSLRAAESARDGYAKEYEAAKMQLAAVQNRQPAAPAYPDLRARVTELESNLATASSEATSAKQQVIALTQAKAEIEKSLATKPSAPAYPDLRSRVAEMETALASASTNATRLQQELTAQAQAKVEAQQQVAALTQSRETAVSTLSRELESTKSALAQANDALRAKPAAPTYPDLSGRVAELEREVAAARSAAPAAPAYPDLSGRVAELESAYTTASTTLAQTQAQLAAMSSEAASAKQEVAALIKAKEDKSSAPAAPTYPDLSGKVAELETQLAGLSTEATRAKQDAAVAAKARDDATQKAAALELARNEVAKQFDDYKSTTAAAQRERTTLLANVKLLESDKASLRRQADSAGTEAGQLRTQVATLKEQLAAKPAAPTYPDLSGRVAQLEAALQAKPGAPAYPDLSGRVAELESAYTAASTTLAQTQAALAAAKAAPAYPDLSGKVAELEGKLAATSKATPAYPDYTSLVKELTTEVTKLRSLREQQQQAIAAATKAKEDALAANAGRVKELEAQVGQLQATLAAAPAAPAYPDLSGRVAELESAFTAASTNLAQAQAQLAAKPAAPAYPDLSGKVAELEGKLAAASNATPAYPDLSGRVSELETRLAAMSSEADRAKQEVAALTKAKEDAKAAPAGSDNSGRIAELESALAESARKLVAADTAQTQLQQQLATAQAAVKAKGDGDTQLSRERDELNGRVTMLNGEVAQLRTDRERMQKMLGDAGRQLRDSSADASRIKELETQVGGLQTSLSTAYAQTNELQAALAAAKAAPAYPDLSGKVAELEAKLAAQPAAPSFPDLRDRVTQLESELTAARSAAPAYPDLSGRVAELEARLATAREPIAAGAPAYPDLSARVRELEAQLAAAPKGRAPSYPNLAGRVVELENALAETRRNLSETETALRTTAQALAATAPVTTPATTPAATETDASDLQKRLAETEGKLATALRGYALLEKDRDALQAKSGQANEALLAEKNTLATQVASLSAQVEQLQAASTAQAEAVRASAAAATEKDALAARLTAAETRAANAQAEVTRLGESLAALQRSTGQISGDALSNRALVQQLQGANAVLAQENYQLKTMLSRTTGGPAAPLSAPTALPAARTHVVASGDSLSKISQRYYGTASRWQEIYNANAGKLGPNGILRVGTELRIP